MIPDYAIAGVAVFSFDVTSAEETPHNMDH